MSCAIGSEVNRRRVTARGRSRLRFPRAQTRGEAWRSRGLAPRPAFALRGGIPRDDAIDALFAGLLGDKRQAELLRTTAVKKPRTEWGCQAVAFIMVAMVAPC